MLPKEKAQELYWKFYPYTDSEFNEFHHKYTKECALILVNEIIETVSMCIPYLHESTYYEYWEEVKKEIEKL